MNDESANRDNSLEIDRKVDEACSKFEADFRADSEHRIEQILEQVFPEIRDACVPELIKLEVDLRHAAGDQFDRREYKQRFPDQDSVIRVAFERLKNSRTASAVDDDALLATEARAGDGGGFVLKEEGHQGIPSQLGPYRDLTEVGSGNFGIVCRATDSRTGATVALKFPRHRSVQNDKELRQLFQEARLAAQLNHPGIIRTHGIENHDDYLCIVQQFIEGVELETIIESKPSRQESVRLVAKIAKALAFAHQKGIYHRDLKPANVMVDQQWNTYIADFGLAIHESFQRILAGQRCGTAPYMSPEMVQGLSDRIDGRSDIWSLGVILYEMLSGRRPFIGRTTNDVFREIRDYDPKPLRQIDIVPMIDVELERICLKCLYKPVRDRYLAAQDLAEDLRFWLQSTQDNKSDDEANKANGAGDKPAPVLVPKGLRSYGREDADFFLQLLPGPRDRDKIPASVRFWSVRVEEPVASEHRTPIGVIYGPSGCGKSSFVKAGLLPRVGDTVNAAYVESTGHDTEVRLIRSLRDQFKEIPNELALPEILGGLQQGMWNPDRKKVLIVLDQFEQWLNAKEIYPQEQLTHALRHCDGQHLQCLLLVRDDFWLALSRFMDALELDLLEGQNSQVVDLFDKQHAKRVLIELGRAYHCLFQDSAALTTEQEQFLESAIDELASGDHVICVRLTLFAEMFKNRAWTKAELKSVGGSYGVGQTFLDETFASVNSPARYRLHRKAAEGVLEALLPDTGTDIRGHMKSEQELMAASGLESRPAQFSQLIEILDHALRLITATDPDIADTSQLAEGTKSGAKFFQLTHDYLVPSIRNWLTTELRKTRSGRARLRLRELSAAAPIGERPRILPTHFEWLTWQFLIPRRVRSPRDDNLMTYGRHRFVKAATMVTCSVVVGVVISTFLLLENARRERHRKLNALIDDLIGQEISEAPKIVAELIPLKEIARPKLQSILDDRVITHRARIRAAMGLLPHDTDKATFLVDEIVQTKCTPKELKALGSVLNQWSAQADLDLLSVLEQDQNPRKRFRAACALIESGASGIDWNQYSSMLATAILTEPQTSRDGWIEILKKVSQQILPKFQEIFDASSDGHTCSALGSCVYSFTRGEDLPSFLASVIPSANDAQFAAVMSLVEAEEDTRDFQNVLLDQIKYSEGEPKLASVAVALLRLDSDSTIVRVLSDTESPGQRAYAIDRLNRNRVSLHHLRSLYNSQELENVTFRRSLLMAMAAHAELLLDDDLKEWLHKTAVKHFFEDVDPGCHSTAELILKRLGIKNIASTQDKWTADKQRDRLANLFMNGQKQTFVVIDHNLSESVDSPFAVMTTELTMRDWREFPGAKRYDPYQSLVENNTDDLPFVFNDLRQVTEYCNWLSQKNGIPQDQWCFPLRVDLANANSIRMHTNRVGYRIATIQEWHVLCRANSKANHFYGDTNDLASNYAWIAENSMGSPNPVGSLLPNDFGLFDTYGNLFEICVKPSSDPLFWNKGLTVASEKRHLSWSEEHPTAIYNPTPLRQGIRIVKTLELPPASE